MKLTVRQRRTLLAVLLGTSVAVTVLSGENPQPQARVGEVERPIMEEPPVVTGQVSSPKPQAIRIEVDKLARAPLAEGGQDVFAARSWQPARRPAPVAVVVPAPPVAPPLPFEYVGQMDGREGQAAYLSREGEFIVAKAGDVLGDYRVEAVSSDTVTFTYLPLNERQVLAAGIQ